MGRNEYDQNTFYENLTSQRTIKNVLKRKEKIYKLGKLIILYFSSTLGAYIHGKLVEKCISIHVKTLASTININRCKTQS